MFQRLVALCWLGLLLSCSGAPPEALTIDSRVLTGNPLGDRNQRRVAVFSPKEVPRGTPLPMVIYLPGWGSSSENYLNGGGGEFDFLVNQFAANGHPLRIAVVDARSRYGGSQYLNSAATGRYQDFVAEEIVAALAKDYPSPKSRLWIAGHSSGGYGAVRLAMDRPELFSAVVALSPDSDFEVTHKPLVQQPSVTHLSSAEVEASMAPRDRFRLTGDGLGDLVLGLCANYTPLGPDEPGRFEWLYDADHHWRKDVWKRWIAADPLTLVLHNPKAFAPTQAIYLDGAEFDEFGANIGARKMYEVLRDRPAPVTFYEASGHHADHVADRLAKGLKWVFDQKH